MMATPTKPDDRQNRLRGVVELGGLTKGRLGLRSNGSGTQHPAAASSLATEHSEAAVVSLIQIQLRTAKQL